MDAPAAAPPRIGTIGHVLGGIRSVLAASAEGAPAAPIDVSDDARREATLVALDTLEASVHSSRAASSAADSAHYRIARSSHLLPGTELSLPEAVTYAVPRTGDPRVVAASRFLVNTTALLGAVESRRLEETGNASRPPDPPDFVRSAGEPHYFAQTPSGATRVDMTASRAERVLGGFGPVFHKTGRIGEVVDIPTTSGVSGVHTRGGKLAVRAQRSVPPVKTGGRTLRSVTFGGVDVVAEGDMRDDFDAELARGLPEDDPYAGEDPEQLSVPTVSTENVSGTRGEGLAESLLREQALATARRTGPGGRGGMKFAEAELNAVITDNLKRPLAFLRNPRHSRPPGSGSLLTEGGVGGGASNAGARAAAAAVAAAAANSAASAARAAAEAEEESGLPSARDAGGFFVVGSSDEQVQQQPQTALGTTRIGVSAQRASLDGRPVPQLASRGVPSAATVTRRAGLAGPAEAACGPFVVRPASLLWTDYTVGDTLSAEIVVQNIDSLSRHLRLIPPVTRLFSVDTSTGFPAAAGTLATVKGVAMPPGGSSSLIAPGMSVRLTVRFTAPSVEPFSDVLTFVTEGGTFTIPLDATVPAPELDAPPLFSCDPALVHDVIIQSMTVRNIGARGSFRILSAESLDSTDGADALVARGAPKNATCKLADGVFTLWPSALTLGRDETATVSIVFAPTTPGLISSNFIVITSEGDMFRHGIEGIAGEPLVGVTAIQSVVIPSPVMRGVPLLTSADAAEPGRGLPHPARVTAPRALLSDLGGALRLSEADASVGAAAPSTTDEKLKPSVPLSIHFEDLYPGTSQTRIVNVTNDSPSSLRFSWNVDPWSRTPPVVPIPPALLGRNSGALLGNDAADQVPQPRALPRAFSVQPTEGQLAPHSTTAFHIIFAPPSLGVEDSSAPVAVFDTVAALMVHDVPADPADILAKREAELLRAAKAAADIAIARASGPGAFTPTTSAAVEAESAGLHSEAALAGLPNEALGRGFAAATSAASSSTASRVQGVALVPDNRGGSFPLTVPVVETTSFPLIQLKCHGAARLMDVLASPPVVFFSNGPVFPGDVAEGSAELVNRGDGDIVFIFSGAANAVPGFNVSPAAGVIPARGAVPVRLSFPIAPDAPPEFVHGDALFSLYHASWLPQLTAAVMRDSDSAVSAAQRIALALGASELPTPNADLTLRLSGGVRAPSVVLEPSELELGLISCSKSVTLPMRVRNPTSAGLFWSLERVRDADESAGEEGALADVTLDPSSGELLPRAEVIVTVTLNAGLTSERLRALFRGVSFPLSRPPSGAAPPSDLVASPAIAALSCEIASPVIALSHHVLSLGVAFVGMPITRRVTLTNLCAMVVDFTLDPYVGAKAPDSPRRARSARSSRAVAEPAAYRVDASALSGSIAARGSFDIELCFTPLVAGAVDALLAFDIPGMVFPLAMNLTFVARNVTLAYAIIDDASGCVAPRPLGADEEDAAFSRELASGESAHADDPTARLIEAALFRARAAGASINRLPAFEFSGPHSVDSWAAALLAPRAEANALLPPSTPLPLHARATATLLVFNLSGIATTLKPSVSTYATPELDVNWPALHGAAERSDAGSNAAGSACAMPAWPSADAVFGPLRLAPPTEFGVISGDGSQRAAPASTVAKTALSDSHETSSRFASTAGRALVSAQENKAVCTRALARARGAAVQVWPPRIELPAYGVGAFSIGVLTDVPGAYEDLLRVDSSADGSAVASRVAFGSTGNSLKLVAGTVGLRCTSTGTPLDPLPPRAPGYDAAPPARGIRGPVLSFGDVPERASRSTKHVFIENSSSLDAHLTWHAFHDRSPTCVADPLALDISVEDSFSAAPVDGDFKQSEAAAVDAEVSVDAHENAPLDAESSILSISLRPATDRTLFGDVPLCFSVSPSTVLVPAHGRASVAVTFEPRPLAPSDVDVARALGWGAEGDGDEFCAFLRTRLVADALFCARGAAAPQELADRARLAQTPAAGALRPALNFVDPPLNVPDAGPPATLVRDAITLHTQARPFQPRLVVDRSVAGVDGGLALRWSTSSAVLAEERARKAPSAAAPISAGSALSAARSRSASAPRSDAPPGIVHEVTLTNPSSADLSFTVRVDGPFSLLRAMTAAPKAPASALLAPPAGGRALFLPPDAHATLSIAFDPDADSSSARAVTARVAFGPAAVDAAPTAASINSGTMRTTMSTTARAAPVAASEPAAPEGALTLGLSLGAAGLTGVPADVAVDAVVTASLARLRGDFYGALVVNFAGGSEQTVSLHATVVRPAVVVAPAILDLGSVRASVAGAPTSVVGVNGGSSALGTLRLSNPTTVPARWSIKHVAAPPAPTAASAAARTAARATGRIPAVHTLRTNELGAPGVLPWKQLGLTADAAWAQAPEPAPPLDDPTVFAFSTISGDIAGPTVSVDLAEGVQLRANDGLPAPVTIEVRFSPRAEGIFKSRFRAQVAHGESFEFVLTGVGSFQEIHPHK